MYSKEYYESMIVENGVGPKSIKQAMFMSSPAQITVFGGAAGCLDGTAEYFNGFGWNKFSDYDGGMVGQYNHETGSVELVKPEEYIKLPCDKLYRMRARGLDFTLSPEHRVAFFNDVGDKNKIRTLPFSEVIARHNNSVTKGWTGKIKTTFNYCGVGVDLTEAQLRLQVAVQADGSIVKGGKDNYTLLRFSKERKYTRLLDLCKKGNLQFRDKGVKDAPRYMNGKEFEVIVWPKYPDKVFDSKYYQCTQEQLQIIVDEVGHWDGSFVDNDNGRTIRYFSKYKENVDFIQFAMHATGMNTSIVEDKRGGYTVNGTYRGNGLRGFANKDGKCPVEEVETSDGFKYCFSVPSTFLLVRVNDRVFITGNSGKTFVGVMDYLPYFSMKAFRGVITRRTTPQLKGPGGVKDKLDQLFDSVFPRTFYRWNDKENKYIFKSGAMLYLRHFEHVKDEENFQGIECSKFLVDEGTQFEERQVVYLMSRMRNPSNKEVKPHLKITCNPDYNSYLRKWIEWYLLPDGKPDPDKCGVIRYFYRIDDQMVWGDDPVELKAKYKKNSNPISFTFIGANVYDNPVLMEANPEYVDWLEGLGCIEKERLLHGNWYAKEEAVGYFERSWLGKLHQLPENVECRVRSWDIAGALVSDVNPDPDYTVGVRMSKTRDTGKYIVEDVVRDRLRPYDVEQLIIDTARRDGFDTVITIPCDPGAAAQAYAKALVKRLSELGLYARLKMTNKSKVDRFRPFASLAQSGGCDYIEADWNDAYFRELEMFDGLNMRFKKDD